MIAGIVRCSLIAAMLGVATPALLAQTPAGRGDVNGDGSINSTDVNDLVNYFFADGPAPVRACSSDVDASGASDLRDVFLLINFLYAGGPPPTQVAEVCNGADDDCDGVIDNGVTTTFYRDLDGDGFGDLATSQQACTKPLGYVLDHSDCNDQNPAIHPGATELCNGADDNCNGQLDDFAEASCAPANPICQTGPTCVNATCTYANRDAVAGQTTCGLGACKVTQNNCINGLPHTCIPNMGAASTETCNGVDDNCDGIVDNNPAFQDSSEPNNSCTAVTTLTGVGSDQSGTTTATIYGSGDVDYYRVHAVETDSTCANCSCGFLCFDEGYRFSVTLSVPAGAGTYRVCYSRTCGGSDQCFDVTGGTTSNGNVYLFLQGSCGVSAADAYDVYIRVSGSGGAGFSCAPYTLSYHFQSGVCN